MTTTTQEDRPDILEIVYWLNTIKDPIERMMLATLFGDEARDQLLPELASVRRLAAVEGRKTLMEGEGMTATEATRALADRAKQSPQTIMRLISERRQYGG